MFRITDIRFQFAKLILVHHGNQRSKEPYILLIYSLFKGQHQKNQLIPFELLPEAKIERLRQYIKTSHLDDPTFV